MELIKGDTVFIKKNFWDNAHEDSPNYPKEMHYTQNRIGTIQDVSDYKGCTIYEIGAEDGLHWWYGEEALVSLISEERLFELYVKGIITSDEYNTLSKVKEGE